MVRRSYQRRSLAAPTDLRDRGPCLPPPSAPAAAPSATPAAPATSKATPAAPTSATTTFTRRPCFVHDDIATDEIVAVQSLYGALGLVVAIDLDKSEPAWLTQHLARRRRLPAADAAGLGVQMCAGLAAVHGAGLVHRDVKPQNLLLGRDGVLKLGDFGIALGTEGTRLTLAGTVLGTAGYLAPEQARGEQVTAAADIYAVGAVLDEMLGGRAPARAEPPPSCGRRLHPPGSAPP